MELKRGDVRSDGMVFWRYIRHRNNAEAWVTREQLDRYRKKTADSVRLWRNKYPDGNKIACKKWHSENKEYCLQKNREWRKKNKRRHIANAIKWNQRNREKHQISVKKWESRNPQKKTEARALRRARQAAATPNLDGDQAAIMATLYDSAKRVSEKTGIPHEVDHIVPLAKGGMHHPCNLQILPRSINRKKWIKTTQRKTPTSFPVRVFLCQPS